MVQLVRDMPDDNGSRSTIPAKDMHVTEYESRWAPLRASQWSLAQLGCKGAAPGGNARAGEIPHPTRTTPRSAGRDDETTRRHRPIPS